MINKAIAYKPQQQQQQQQRQQHDNNYNNTKLELKNKTEMNNKPVIHFQFHFFS